MLLLVKASGSGVAVGAVGAVVGAAVVEPRARFASGSVVVVLDVSLVAIVCFVCYSSVIDSY